MSDTGPIDMGESLRELGELDVADLRDAILALDAAAWRGNQSRQQAYAVHNQTQSIILVFTNGAGWPDIEVRRESGWDLLAAAAFPLMAEVLGKYYPPGGAIIRAMAVRLDPGGAILSHRDKHPSFQYSHRIHIPIVTNSRARFILAGKPHRFDVGKAYEIDNQLSHGAMNKGVEGRIHFIFDYVPPQHLGQLSNSVFNALP